MTTTDAPPVPVCVKDLKPGDSILQYLELRSKNVRKTRAGQDYLDLVVGDATGTISCKMWGDSIRKWGHDFVPGDFVKIEGRVESYQDRNQLVVEKIRRADPSEIKDSSLLVRSSAVDPQVSFDELTGFADGLEPRELSELVLEILTRHAEAIKTYPAARMIHHAYRGGLVEHIAAVTRKVDAVLRMEPTVNRNIALAGSILHDIGKVLELNPGAQGRTPEGRLIGHVILGLELIRAVAGDLGLLDEPWLKELEHIVLSHHGETQFGAPVKPLTREAVVVHFLDNLDAKLKIIEEALDSVDSEGFTPYIKWLEGRAYAGTRPLPEEDENVGD